MRGIVAAILDRTEGGRAALLVMPGSLLRHDGTSLLRHDGTALPGIAAATKQDTALSPAAPPPFG
jgi:hypothetical protein